MSRPALGGGEKGARLDATSVLPEVLVEARSPAQPMTSEGLCSEVKQLLDRASSAI